MIKRSNQLPRYCPGPTRKGAKDQVIERFEQKYIVHPALVPGIRNYLQSFCIPDPNGSGHVPEYTVTTLQLDTAGMDLALAKERKAFARFKLRIRTYGADGHPENPVFLEVKRKVGGVVIKTRAKMVLDLYQPGMLLSADDLPVLSSHRENVNLLEFAKLVNRMKARPKMAIRYIRESYFGANDDYARVTFDRRVSYRPTREWRLDGPELEGWDNWRSMDTQDGLKRPFAGYILELKGMRETPRWMLDMIERFNLISTGFCKYATAWRLESLHRGFEYTCGGENTTH